MSYKQRIEITVETEQLLVLRRRRATALCAQCASPVELLTAEEAATAAGVSLSSIQRSAEEQRLHFSETAEGRLLVCLNSLLDLTTKGEFL